MLKEELKKEKLNLTKTETINVILCIGDFKSSFHDVAIFPLLEIFSVLFKRHFKFDKKQNLNIFFPVNIFLSWKKAIMEFKKHISRQKTNKPNYPIITKNIIKLSSHNIISSEEINPDIVYPLLMSDSDIHFTENIFDILKKKCFNILGIISYSHTFHANKLLQILKYFDIPILITLATTIDYGDIFKYKNEYANNILRLVPSNESQAEVLRTAIETAYLESKNSFRVHILSKPYNNMYINNLSNLIYNLFNDKMIIEHFDDEIGITQNNPNAILVVSYPTQFDLKKSDEFKRSNEDIKWYFTDSYYLYFNIENNLQDLSVIENSERIRYISPASNIKINIDDAFLSLYEVWNTYKKYSVTYDTLNFMTNLKNLLTNDIRFSGRYIFRANINVMGGFKIESLKKNNI